MTVPRPILDGLRVLDVGTFIFGPAATTVMSDFGAAVIKIENPAGGDPYRYLHLMPPMPESDRPYCFLLDGRNKRSVALDLSDDDARAILYRLVRDADVFVTNYHPSVLAKLHLTWDELRPLNPRLIYAQASGYGELGEEVEKPGFDATAWWARSGMMEVLHQHGAEPSLSVAGMGDHPSAMSLFGAIMMALYHRQQTGEGSKVASSLMANGVWSNSCLLQAILVGAQPYQPMARSESPNALVNLYQTKDSRWIFLALLSEDRDWAPLARALACEELLVDPRFVDLPARRANSRQLFQRLAERFATQDLGYWRQALDRHNVTFGIVAQPAEVCADAQMRDNGVFVDVEAAGTAAGYRTIDSPIWVEGHPKSAARPAPEVGEHTDEVLAELGVERSQIDALRSRGAIR